MAVRTTLARFAFYVGDQAETTVIPLKGFIVQHISEPPQALRDSHLDRCARAHQEHGDGGLRVIRLPRIRPLYPFAQVKQV